MPYKMMRFNLNLLLSLFIVSNTTLYAQSIVHFQNWEGQVGAGNWIAGTGGTNNWIRGTDAAGVDTDSKGSYVSSDGSAYGYDATVAEETYSYKDVDLPSDGTLDIVVTFNWKCVGEAGFDYMKVYIVDRSLATPTETNIEAYGGFVHRLNSGNEFSAQSTFTTFSETLPTTVEGRSDLRIVFTWTNDDNTTNGVPAAFDNVIISLGPPPSSLSGEYAVGQASGSYFSTLTEAIYFLNTYGVSGDVNFKLTDALYDNSTESFPIVIENFNSTPSANAYTFTLKPDAGVTSSISGAVTGNSTIDGIYHGLITLNKADNITIDGSNNGTTSRDLTVNNTSPNAAKSIFIASESPDFNDNITIKNTIIETAYTTGGSISVGIVMLDDTYSTGAGGFSNISFNNNQFLKGNYAVYIDGGSAGSINGSLNSVSNNDMEPSGTNAIGQVGMYIRGVSAGTISGNVIGNIDDTDGERDYGIYLASGATNLVIEKNEIYNIGYSGTAGFTGMGIRILSQTTGASNTIRNNIIYNIYGDGRDITGGGFDYNPFAILLTGTQTGMDIYNNSIYLNGNTLNQTNALSVGIGLGTGSTADIRNNIIVNNLGLAASTGVGSAGIFAQSSNTQFEAINYNNYYTNASGNGTNYTGRISTTNYSTLADWKTASGSDASSISADPGYTSTSNLLPDATNSNSWHANGTGVQIAAVTEDFNGVSRSTTVPTGAPDMGAYEFTPSSTPPTAVVTGSHTNGGTETFTSGGRTIAEITWGASGTLPSITALRYFSGANPPDPVPGSAEYFNSYMEITTTGGSGYTYDITLYYDEALIGTLSSEADIRLSKDDGSGWISFGSDVPNTSSNYVASTGLASFSVFTGSDIDNLLPVELVYFKGEHEGNQVLLTWKTASEINNDYFQVERSIDTKTWSAVGRVTGSGSTNTPVSYSFSDQESHTGTSYYRLKQVDFDGSFSYSDVVAVYIPAGHETQFVQTFPNPTDHELTVRYKSSGNTKVRVQINDNTGRTRITEDLSPTSGINTEKIDLSDLRPGTYVLRLVEERGAVSVLFVKE